MADFDDIDYNNDFEQDNDIENDDNNEEKKEESNNNKRNLKGRGHEAQENEISHPTKSGNFDSLNSLDDESTDKNVQKSVEGYVLFVTGVHEEAKDDDIYEKFSEFGHVKQFHVPLDRRTGFVKGYALIEFATFKEAQSAINGCDQTDLYGKILTVDWAFTKPY